MVGGKLVENEYQLLPTILNLALLPPVTRVWSCVLYCVRALLLADGVKPDVSLRERKYPGSTPTLGAVGYGKQRAEQKARIEERSHASPLPCPPREIRARRAGRILGLE